MLQNCLLKFSIFGHTHSRSCLLRNRTLNIIISSPPSHLNVIEQPVQRGFIFPWNVRKTFQPNKSAEGQTDIRRDRDLPSLDWQIKSFPFVVWLQLFIFFFIKKIMYRHSTPPWHVGAERETIIKKIMSWFVTGTSLGHFLWAEISCGGDSFRFLGRA